MSMKKQRSKEMSGAEPTSKNKALEAPEKTSLSNIRCLRDCDMPGTGLFFAGEVISDPDLIVKIGDNPNFEKFSEEA